MITSIPRTYKNAWTHKHEYTCTRHKHTKGPFWVTLGSYCLQLYFIKSLTQCISLGIYNLSQICMHDDLLWFEQSV